MVTGFDIRLLYTYFRVYRNEFVNKDRINEILRVIDFSGVNRRDE